MELIREVLAGENEDDFFVIYRDSQTNNIIFLTIISKGQPVFMDTGLYQLVDKRPVKKPE